MIFGDDGRFRGTRRHRLVMGIVMSVGSMAGGAFGARLSLSAGAERYIYGLPTLAVTAELGQLSRHHVDPAL